MPDEIDEQVKRANYSLAKVKGDVAKLAEQHGSMRDRIADLERTVTIIGVCCIGLCLVVMFMNWSRVNE